ncbi:MAG: 50S ribosomal protein L32 [Chloroflexia bacterium]
MHGSPSWASCWVPTELRSEVCDMGALPKRKVSHHRRGNRRSHQALKAPQQMLCPECKEPALPHRVCPSCGTYNGRKVIETREEKKRRKKEK